MIPHFIFCSGWGFRSQFWDPLLAYFKPGSYTVLKSVHEGAGQTDFNLAPMTDRAFIGIGHSLGFKKLLNLPVSYNRLIGLQAFTCFSGFEDSLNQKRQRFLALMIKKFSHQPQTVLSEFYQKCGADMFSEIQLSQPDEVSLGEDLKLLLDSQSAPLQIPVMVLGTSQDKIVPPAVIYDNFARMKNVTMEILDLQGHCLGYQYLDIVFRRIATFVNASL